MLLCLKEGVKVSEQVRSKSSTVLVGVCTGPLLVDTEDLWLS